MAFGAGQTRRGALVVFVLRARQQLGPATPAWTGESAFVTDEQNAVTVELFRTFHSVRARWFEAAFVPGEFDGGFVSPWRKLVGVKSRCARTVFFPRPATS